MTALPPGDKTAASIPAPRRRFKLHVVSVALLVLVVGLRLVGGILKAEAIGGDDGGAIAVEAILFCMLLPPIAYVLGWVAFQIGGRSNLLGNLMFIIVLCGTNQAAYRAARDTRSIPPSQLHKTSRSVMTARPVADSSLSGKPDLRTKLCSWLSGTPA